MILLYLTRGVTLALGIFWLLMWIQRYLIDGKEAHRLRFLLAGIAFIVEQLIVSRLIGDDMRGIGYHATFGSVVLIFALGTWALIEALKANYDDTSLLLIAGSELVALGMWLVELFFWGSWIIVCPLGYLLIGMLAVAGLRQYLRERKAAA
jgi:hypothetical protein